MWRQDNMDDAVQIKGVMWDRITHLYKLSGSRDKWSGQGYWMSACQIHQGQCDRSGPRGHPPSTACSVCQKPRTRKYPVNIKGYSTEHILMFHPLQSSLSSLRVVDSQSKRPSQWCVDKGNSVASISVASHYDRRTVPVRPKQVPVDRHLIEKAREQICLGLFKNSFCETVTSDVTLWCKLVSML